MPLVRGARLTAQVEGCQVVGRALRPAKINKIYFLASPQVQYSRIQTTKEGTPKFKILTLILAVIGLLVGLFLPFRTLVNVIYVLNGYVGAILIIFMLKKNITDYLAKKKKA